MNALRRLFAFGVLATACVLGASCGSAQPEEKRPTEVTAAPPAAQRTPSQPASAVPIDADSGYDKAAQLAAAGKLPEARAIFEASSRRDPGDGSVAAGAAIFADLAAGRVSGDVVQRIFRSLQHADAGRWTEAQKDMDEALRLAPQYARAHATQAALFTSQGQYPDAVAALDQALTIDPQFSEGYYNRGAVRAELKQIDAAIADYNRALALEPSMWVAYRNRASAYTHKNDPQAAIADYAKALELRPLDVETRLLRALMHITLNQWDAAFPDLTRAIELDPKHPGGLYHLGLAHERKGDVERARADYAAAIEFDADGDVAAAARHRLAVLDRRSQE